MQVLRSVVLALLIAGAAMSGAPPEGLYLRSVFRGNSLQNSLFLFRGGEVATGLNGNLEPFDFARHKREQPQNYGTYTLQGSTLNVKWGDGTEWTGTVRPDRSGGFDYRSDPYAPMKPLAPGAVLEGRFYGGAGGGTAMVAFDYTFSADGTFQSNSAGTVSTTSRQSTVTAGNSGKVSGRFQVQGKYLQLTFADGSSGRFELYYVPTSAGPQKPDMLVLAGMVITKM